MDKYVRIAALMASMGFAAGAAWSKLPPPPPVDPAAKAAADEKKAAEAAKTKAELLAAEERAVKNYQDNMRKAGKPLPKPTPIAAAQAPTKPGDAKGAPTKAPEKAGADKAPKKS
jgi:hypothetical protein